MNRHPRAATSPPSTAVSLVDFLLQIPTVSGDRNREIEADRAPNQPGKKKIFISIGFAAGKFAKLHRVGVILFPPFISTGKLLKRKKRAPSMMMIGIR